VSLVLALFEPSTGQPEASRSLPPDTVGGGVMWMVILVVILTTWLVVAPRRRAGREGGRTIPGGTAVGNALHDLASVLSPDRPDAAVIQKLSEEGEHDARGDGRDPEKTRPSPRHPRQSPHD
jgi:hypothetical protein